MRWFKAVFAKGDEGIRHWTRLKFQRDLRKSQSTTSFERRLSALAATIESRNAMNGITAFSMEDCILEAAPIAMHPDALACDILEEYIVCRATGASTRQEWLEFEINRGLTTLLSDPSPLLRNLKKAVAQGYKNTGAVWDRWLSADNVALLHDNAAA
jgi:hypothetical protein